MTTMQEFYTELTGAKQHQDTTLDALAKLTGADRAFLLKDKRLLIWSLWG